MNLIRPNGMVERLTHASRPAIEFDGYGRTQAGATTPDAQRTATRQDRRRQRRRKPDPLRGRLLDVTA